MELNLESKCAVSEDVVARTIEDELVIIPLASGIGDMEDELFTMNETGKAIWGLLDGEKTIQQIIDELASEFEAEPGKIQKDVIGILSELVRMKMVVVQ